MLKASVLVALGLAFASAAVHADDAPADEIPEIVVDVGATVTTDVGYAMGSFCDDDTIVHAEMQNGTADNNHFVVTGLKGGSTLCRVGTILVQHRPSFLYRVTVLDPSPPAKSPKKRR